MTEPTRVTDLPEKWRGPVAEAYRTHTQLPSMTISAAADELEAALKADPVVRVAELLRHADQYFGPRRINVATCIVIACGFYDDGEKYQTPHSKGCPLRATVGTEDSDD